MTLLFSPELSFETLSYFHCFSWSISHVVTISHLQKLSNFFSLSLFFWCSHQRLNPSPMIPISVDVFQVNTQIMQYYACKSHNFEWFFLTLTLLKQDSPSSLESTISSFCNHTCPAKPVVKVPFFLGQNCISIRFHNPCWQRECRISNYQRWYIISILFFSHSRNKTCSYKFVDWNITES